MPPVKELKGIGGWLILIAVNLIFTPINILLTLFQTYSELFDDVTLYDMIEIMNNENSLIIYSLLIMLVLNLIIFTMYILAVYWFFNTDYRFPKFYILLLVFFIVVHIVDIILGEQLLHTYLIPSENPGIEDAIRQIIYTCIWAPYMLVSRRVKNTFISGRKAELDNIPA